MSSSAYVERVGRLVVDANIALGVILGGPDGATRRLVRRLAELGVPLLAPQEMISEVEEHFADALARSLARRNIVGAAYARGQQDAEDAWREMQTLLRVIPSREYQDFEATARRRVPADPDDWPYVALALRLDCGILTKNITHFGGSGIPVWNLETVALILEE